MHVVHNYYGNKEFCYGTLSRSGERGTQMYFLVRLDAPLSLAVVQLSACEPKTG